MSPEMMPAMEPDPKLQAEQLAQNYVDRVFSRNYVRAELEAPKVDLSDVNQHMSLLKQTVELLQPSQINLPCVFLGETYVPVNIVQLYLRPDNYLQNAPSRANSEHSYVSEDDLLDFVKRLREMDQSVVKFVSEPEVKTSLVRNVSSFLQERLQAITRLMRGNPYFNQHSGGNTSDFPVAISTVGSGFGVEYSPAYIADWLYLGASDKINSRLRLGRWRFGAKPVPNGQFVSSNSIFPVKETDNNFEIFDF
jgi:hypothetical protein